MSNTKNKEIIALNSARQWSALFVLLAFAGFSTGATQAAWTASVSLPNNSVSAGTWYTPPPVPEVCFVPNNLGDNQKVKLGKAPQGEPSLQQFVKDKFNILTASSSQENYQVWNVNGPMEISLDIEFLGAYAGHAGVFGYYADGGEFVPIFKTQSYTGAYHTGFDSTSPAMLNNPMGVSVTASSTIGFALKTQDPKKTNKSDLWKTETAGNSDGMRHAVVYELGAGEYLVAFEDLHKNDQNLDKDYNDMIVRIKLIGCVVPSVPEEPEFEIFSLMESFGAEEGEIVDENSTSTDNVEEKAPASHGDSSAPAGETDTEVTEEVEEVPIDELAGEEEGSSDAASTDEIIPQDDVQTTDNTNNGETVEQAEIKEPEELEEVEQTPELEQEPITIPEEQGGEPVQEISDEPTE